MRRAPRTKQSIIVIDDILQEDITKALRNRREFDAGVLRMLRAALHNEAIAKRSKGGEGALSDEEAMQVLRREAKKRREAEGAYRNAKRDERAASEAQERALIERYLPAQMSREDVLQCADNVADEFGGWPALTQKDFGRVMGEVMRRTKGQGDAQALAEIVRARLEASRASS